MMDAEIIRIGTLIAALSGNAWLADLATGGARGTVVEAVRLGAYAVLWSAAYMWLSALWHQRPVLQELPMMSLASVLVYVYGMGALAFVTTYATLCVSAPCVCNYAVAAGFLCGCDLLCQPDYTWLHRVITATAALFAVLAVVGCTVEDDDFARVVDGVGTAAGLGDFGFGVLLPLIAPMVFHFARETRRPYSPRVVFELIHFAMPFAVILALVTLAMLPGPDRPQTRPDEGAPGRGTRPGNATFAQPPLSHAARTDALLPAGFTGPTLADAATAALPLTAVLIFFFAIQSAVLYSTIDFLTSFALVACARYFAYHAPQPEAVLGMSMAAVAFLIRVCTSTAFDDDGGAPTTPPPQQLGARDLEAPEPPPAPQPEPGDSEREPLRNTYALSD